MPTNQNAFWLILFVCPPSQPQQPAGIILFNILSNRLSIRAKAELGTLDEDIELVWTGFVEDLIEQSKQYGINETLHLLENSASNAFQVSGRHYLEVIYSSNVLADLYSTHIGQLSESLLVEQ